MKLYRPVALAELSLIFDAEMRAFPPRLPEQPVFYPVLNELGYSGMDFLCELAANNKVVFLNFPFWAQNDFSAGGISAEQKAEVLGAIKQEWSERSPEIPRCRM